MKIFSGLAFLFLLVGVWGQVYNSIEGNEYEGLEDREVGSGEDAANLPLEPDNAEEPVNYEARGYEVPEQEFAEDDQVDDLEERSLSEDDQKRGINEYEEEQNVKDELEERGLEDVTNDELMERELEDVTDDELMEQELKDVTDDELMERELEDVTDDELMEPGLEDDAEEELMERKLDEYEEDVEAQYLGTEDQEIDERSLTKEERKKKIKEWKEKLAKWRKRRRDRLNVSTFLFRITGKLALLTNLRNYGCFCGGKAKGEPVDAIDSCCEAMRKCRIGVRKAVIKKRKEKKKASWFPWRFSCRYQRRCSGKPGEATCKCSGKEGSCGKMLCDCQLTYAKCVKKNMKTYKKKNRDMRSQCGTSDKE